MPVIVFEPTISNPFELIAVAAGGPYTLGIAEPTETGNVTLTVTIDSLPAYGTVQYLNGATWTDVDGPDAGATGEFALRSSGEWRGQRRHVVLQRFRRDPLGHRYDERGGDRRR
jgi:hypothetical protein